MLHDYCTFIQKRLNLESSLCHKIKKDVVFDDHILFNKF